MVVHPFSPTYQTPPSILFQFLFNLYYLPPPLFTLFKIWIMNQFNMDTESVNFTTNKLEMGRISHYATYGTLKFHQKEVLKSGKCYFICCESGCKARLIAQYASKEASTSDELPMLTRYYVSMILRYSILVHSLCHKWFFFQYSFMPYFKYILKRFFLSVWDHYPSVKRNEVLCILNIILSD